MTEVAAEIATRLNDKKTTARWNCPWRGAEIVLESFRGGNFLRSSILIGYFFAITIEFTLSTRTRERESEIFGCRWDSSSPDLPRGKTKDRYGRVGWELEKSRSREIDFRSK